MPTKRLLIKGKVQGVFYRAGTKDKADLLGITGWVRNTAGGDVETLATGTEAQLNEFIAWCRNGPPRAMVDEVIVHDEKDEIFNGFIVKR